MKKIKVGQEVWVRRVGNEAGRCDRDALYRPHIVEGVGPKYFRVAGLRCKFRVGDFRELSDYAPNYKVYLDEQTILDEDEFLKKYEEISQCFSIWKRSKLSLDQIRRIHKVVVE
jgi:hypothetical protein